MRLTPPRGLLQHGFLAIAGKTAMAYIDGFVLAVPTANRDVYRASAAKAWVLFKEFGAIRQVECWGDDVPDGKVTDFRGAVKAAEDEVVVFSWVEYPSKAIRDAANKKMMEDERMTGMSDIPFDGQRMIVGGFAPILDEMCADVSQAV
jgi:uncharacterized protein YbaA (DUF1428 family)